MKLYADLNTDVMWWFDVILGMNWLSKYHVTVNHFTEEVVFKLSDYKKNDIPRGFDKELIVYTLLGEFW